MKDANNLLSLVCRQNGDGMKNNNIKTVCMKDNVLIGLSGRILFWLFLQDFHFIS